MNEKSTTIGAHSNGVWHRPDIRPTSNWNGDFPPGTPLVSMYDREDLGYGPKWRAEQRAARFAELAADVTVAAAVEAPEFVAAVPAADSETAEHAVVVAADVSAYTGSAVAAASFNAPAPMPAAVGVK